MRSILAFVCALLVGVLGCLPQAVAAPPVQPANRVVAVVARGTGALLDAYLMENGPESAVRAGWAPVWERWEELDEALQAYREALEWGEVAGEDDAVVEAYCTFLEVLPERADVAALREPALCAEVSP